MGYYFPALGDVPVWAWHLLLLALILGSAYVLYPSTLCPRQCPWAYLIPVGVIIVGAAASLVSRLWLMKSVQKKLLGPVEGRQQGKFRAAESSS